MQSGFLYRRHCVGIGTGDFYSYNEIIFIGNIVIVSVDCILKYGLVYWGLTPQQQPGSYQGGEMMMKSVFWWRKLEYPEETTDLPLKYVLLYLLTHLIH